MEKQTRSLTATQRLEGLEASVGILDQSIGNLASNLQTAINALTLLTKKVEAIVRAGNAGKPISASSVAAELIQINVEELKEKVSDLQKRGLAVESTEVQENSFIVGRELDAETKEVANDRVQFPLFGLAAEIKSKLMGKKVGDILGLSEGMNLLEITEIYNLVLPTTTGAQAASSAESEEKTNEEVGKE